MSKIRVDQLETLDSLTEVNVSDLGEVAGVADKVNDPETGLDRRVIYVDTIAGLQALDTSGLVDGQAASVQGSKFRWDGFEWVTVGGLNITAFGVEDSATLDQSVAVQDAINFCHDKSVSVLTLNVSNLSCSGVDLKGVSLISSKNATTVKASTGSATLFSTSETGPFFVERIILDGDGLESTPLLVISNHDGVTLRDCGVINSATRSIVFEQGVRGVLVDGGVYRDSTAPDVFVVKSRFNVIKGVHFVNIVEHAIRFGRFSADTDEVSGTNSVVTGCTFNTVTNDPINCELDSQDIVISGNTFDRCRNICKADLTGESDRLARVTVVGNTFKRPRGVAFTRGVSAVGCPEIHIEGNMIDMRLAEVNGIAESNPQGIVAQGPNSKISNNVMREAGVSILCGENATVTNNRIFGFTTSGVRATGERCLIEGNFIRSSSSGTEGIRVENIRGFVTSNKIHVASNAVNLTSSATESLVINNDARFSGGGIVGAGVSGSTVENNYT
jgi:hypothetical protein